MSFCIVISWYAESSERFSDGECGSRKTVNGYEGSKHANSVCRAFMRVDFTFNVNCWDLIARKVSGRAYQARLLLISMLWPCVASPTDSRWAEGVIRVPKGLIREWMTGHSPLPDFFKNRMPESALLCTRRRMRNPDERPDHRRGAANGRASPYKCSRPHEES